MAPDEEMREGRQKLGLTQAALADAFALGQNGKRTIRRYEAGEVEPSGPVLTILRLMLAFPDVASHLLRNTRKTR